MSFRSGLAGLNEKAPAAQRAEIDSSFFVVAYVGIALPAIGDGVMTQLLGLRTAGFIFAAVVAAIAMAGLVLLVRALRGAGSTRMVQPRPALAPSGSQA